MTEGMKVAPDISYYITFKHRHVLKPNEDILSANAYILSVPLNDLLRKRKSISLT